MHSKVNKDKKYKQKYVSELKTISLSLKKALTGLVQNIVNKIILEEFFDWQLLLLFTFYFSFDSTTFGK